MKQESGDNSLKPQDFNYFNRQHSRSKEYNQARLKVKRKLASMGKKILPILTNQGFPVKTYTSLHHPYTYNKFNVESLWLYFSPQPSFLKNLLDIMGSAFAKDIKSHYNHILLIIGIEEQGLFISLKIHPQAWWDGQNLKNKCANKRQCQVLLNYLNKLQGFNLKLHDWPKKQKCELLKLVDLQQYFKYYIPGEHWLHLDYSIDKTDTIITSTDFCNFAQKKLLDLEEVYKFIIWHPDNNYVPQLIS